ncbi:uncharacterized protein LACBIDRAFT_313550 [Laccaria bicolor S238N-H82]|uniref:Predicted protein n=1 Tax=Laccaria bicolor (strain S238N-H82 / ATCC MYA-4686) TaxID=486041 RepID=B0D089_LACBS|nr:uncharacterized protein LACBIDRAFT_313550 [Laccaria bicolor S238N-H82]EDR11412.1 predicted protein [Laccaria bicolor S238N-H82]|eukprot:XP_001877309.1 predicted protein [Laccaria bicolor S238N-H82]
MRVRRKPQFTYKSPSGVEDLLVPATRSSNVQSCASPELASRSSPLPPEITEGIIYCDTQRRKTRKCPVSRTLPLYHPLGRLALSLPLLDPSAYGLPIPTLTDESSRRLSGRTRRPVAKLRELEEDMAVPIPTVSSIAAVAAREVKERPSPRKRRAGGAKRKRKEVEDGDATYPAKRSRLLRGAANADEESPTEIEAAATDATPGPDETNTERRLQRFATTRLTRSTRRPESRDRESRDSPESRDSSLSDTASLKMKTEANAQEKEEGELSEECVI